MKRIGTPVEPPCLAAWRDEHPDATWDEFRNENRDAPNGQRGCAKEVLETLIHAQRGLCAYCELSLREVPSHWPQVEHWHPKDPAQYPGHNWGLDFSNFMAACEGGEKAAPDLGRSLPPIKKTKHCGSAKGNEDHTAVLLDPRRDVPQTPTIWRFDPNGGIAVSPDAPQAHKARAEQTITLLNLDSPVLRRLRKQHWIELENDVQSVWEELGDSEEGYRSAVAKVTAERLGLSPEGRLDQFWSTSRAFFEDIAEAWLAEHPEVFA
ncbi:TIGR02646 family protein [Myxococcota bacterium]|nr:TIGR02646 family protein [Myxococcota bacterium]